MLRDTMTIDTWSVFEVTEDGRFRQHLGHPCHLDNVDGDDYSALAPWTPVTGHSNQHSYRGPVMHDSESLSGGMLTALLERPGLYQCVPVRWETDPSNDPEWEGWMLLHIPAERA